MIELRKDGKTYQYVQWPLKCPANMVYNAINYEPKPENRMRYGNHNCRGRTQSALQ